MSPITHLMTSWLASNTLSFRMRERSLITFAGLSPDIDGFGLAIDFFTKNSENPTNYWGELHHSLHTLSFSLIVAFLVFFIATKNRVLTSVFSFGMFQLHLICDLIGARGPDGYQWPIPYLMPFSEKPELVWAGQWELNAWQNIVISIILFCLVWFVAVTKNRTPFEVVSSKFNVAFLSITWIQTPSASKFKPQFQPCNSSLIVLAFYTQVSFLADYLAA